VKSRRGWQDAVGIEAWNACRNPLEPRGGVFGAKRYQKAPLALERLRKAQKQLTPGVTEISLNEGY